MRLPSSKNSSRGEITVCINADFEIEQVCICFELKALCIYVPLKETGSSVLCPVNAMQKESLFQPDHQQAVADELISIKLLGILIVILK